MADEEADHRRPQEEGGMTELDHDGEHSAAADVAGDCEYLRRDHADSQCDQCPAEEQRRQAADEGHRAVAGRGAGTAEPDDCAAAEASDETVTKKDGCVSGHAGASATAGLGSGQRAKRGSPRLDH
jgi:hypothetical protein